MIGALEKLILEKDFFMHRNSTPHCLFIHSDSCHSIILRSLRNSFVKSQKQLCGHIITKGISCSNIMITSCDVIMSTYTYRVPQTKQTIILAQSHSFLLDATK